MPTINLPGFPVTLGDTTDADLVMENIYDPMADSFEVINGNLSLPNFNVAYLFPREAIQKGALTGGGGVSGTANLDYFHDWFQGLPANPNLGGDFVGQNNSRYVPIPGGSVEFYLPYHADVILTWTILWASDSLGQGVFIRLFEGESGAAASTNEQVRLTAGCASSITFLCNVKTRSRYWSGHHSIEALSPGFHSFSLRILMDNADGENNVSHARVWARSMRYFYFMQPVGGG